MEFNKSRIYSAVNADELRAGDKVIVAMSMQDLRDEVEKGFNIVELEAVLPEHYMDRFSVHVIKKGDSELRQTALAYLVERKENCANCDLSTKNADDLICTKDGRKIFQPTLCCGDFRKKKAEKHYRPFKNTEELQQVWGSRCNEGKGYILNSLDMPHIWVRYKKENGSKSKGHLIHGFYDDIVEIQDRTMSMEDLFYFCEFLDGSPCGVEE